MYIGSLNKYIKEYNFYRRGTKIPMPPDYLKEEGYVLRGGWKYTATMDIGIDAFVNLKHSCYVDSVTVKLVDATTCVKIEVFTVLQGGSLEKIGETIPCVPHSVPAVPNDNPLITVVTATDCDNLVIRLNTNFQYKNLLVEYMTINGAVPDYAEVYPRPKTLCFYPDTTISLSAITAIETDTTCNKCKFASGHLAERLEEEYGITLPIKPYGKQSDFTITINKLNTTAPETYSLDVHDHYIRINAADRRGLVYGVESLLQLINPETLEIPCVLITDSPYMQFRGAHFGLPERDQIPFFKRLIKYLLVPMKYNTLFIEVAAGMRYDSHPEINEVWMKACADSKLDLCPVPGHRDMIANNPVLEKSEVREIVEYAESFGLEVIPEIQSLSHVQYITLSHPEIGEVSGQFVENEEGENLFVADIVPHEEYPSCYCPSNPKSYEIILDLTNEILEVFKPKRYVHMGHDEVYRIGVCPICKDKDPAELFAYDINLFHSFLKERGLKMMIWGDMLQDVTNYKTPPAIDMIPKDIIMLDFIWYFNFGLDIEDHLLKHGFEVIMGNMYSSHYPRFKSRAAKPGIIGAQVSTWVSNNEYDLAYEGKMYDLLYSAGMMWTHGYEVNCRRSYDLVVRKFIPDLRLKLRNQTPYDYEQVPLLAADEQIVVASPANAYASTIEVTFKVNGINAAGFFDAIEFTHASLTNVERKFFSKLIKIGEYEIKYTDGCYETIDVEYGGNICEVNRPHAEPMPQEYYRHEGYIGTYLADPVEIDDGTLYRFTWDNPYPEKEIACVKIRGCGNHDAEILLYEVNGLRKC
ncbi:MAG: beta-N-acetylhexosaminidase [Oscillospiraceae bacterium]|nr:beta-N-acetylhexosaminidase [Oscillospiraceae bacterium]